MVVIVVASVCPLVSAQASPADSGRKDCFGMTATILGAEGPETITGTSGPDVINGLGGDDTILGLDGDDVLCGGLGNDNVQGGNGNDRIAGDWLAESEPAGDDVVEGEAGDD